MKTLRLPTLLLVVFILLSCARKTGLKELFELPKKLKEISAVEKVAHSDLLWTLEDSGNAPMVYGINSKGKIGHTVSLTGVTNVDWEELTSDAAGNLYVGDFGNNDNKRKDLAIYKINAEDLGKTATVPAETITFYYPEQKAFPPKKSEYFYDCEAFFIFQNTFYLFTKNRSKGFDGTTLVYKIPNTPGNHPAEYVGSYKTCNIFNHCAITSAAISPDGSKMVLLSNSRVWLFTNYKADHFLDGTAKMLELGLISQKEGVCFKDNTTLFITDERKKKTGGKLYEFALE